MSFCHRTHNLGVLKLSKLGLSQFWKLITFCEDLLLRWDIKQSCSLRQELFNDISYVIYKQINQGNSWLWMVGSQIGSLTLSISFGHNLCFKYLNGTYEPILNIYILKTLQWYNEIFDLMNLGSWKCSLKIWRSIGLSTPKMGTHLKKCGFIVSHLFTFFEAWNVIPKLHFGPHLCKPLFWLQVKG
jgi:hypothetical protein